MPDVDMTASRQPPCDRPRMGPRTRTVEHAGLIVGALKPGPQQHRGRPMRMVTDSHASVWPLELGIRTVVEGGFPVLRPLLFLAFRILHDVLCGGKVACICLQLW